MAEVSRLQTRIDGQRDMRPALWGETTDGLTIPHYDRALSLVAEWDHRSVIAAWRAEDEEGRARRRAPYPFRIPV